MGSLKIHEENFVYKSEKNSNLIFCLNTSLLATA